MQKNMNPTLERESNHAIIIGSWFGFLRSAIIILTVFWLTPFQQSKKKPIEGD